MCTQTTLAVAALCAILGTSVSHATTIHTWKDANGVTHFADAPPDSNASAQTIEIDDSLQDSSDNEEHYYSIANQWQRLKAEREAADQLKLERDKLKSAERERLTALALEAQNSASSYGYPIYPLNDYRRGFDRGLVGYGSYHRGNGYRSNRINAGYGRGHRSVGAERHGYRRPIQSMGGNYQQSRRNTNSFAARGSGARLSIRF